MHRIWDRARGNLKNHAMGKKSVGISFFSGYAHFAKWVEKIFSNIPPIDHTEPIDDTKMIAEMLSSLQLSPSQYYSIGYIPENCALT